ncbi:MAG TPA: protein translocase subunit SecDF, partial [Devosia sp.]|nr:protein translocase subunit SecDF [Devosia sp.]
MQFSPIRTAVIALVAILGVLFAIPSFLPDDVRESWPSFLPKQTVVLGLDLQGGSHLLLQVNQDGIVSERLQSLRRDVRNTLAGQNGIGNLITTDAATRTLTIELTDPSQKAQARTLVEALQNTISNALIVVGGVQELAFGETPDGRLTVQLTEEG